MKAKDIQVGGVYMMKVSGRVVPVRVDRIRERFDYKDRSHTVYDCTNTLTGRSCQARSPSKFRCTSKTAELIQERRIPAEACMDAPPNVAKCM